MSPYFASPERIAQLHAASMEVIGTPFFANSEAPGAQGGMDCVHLLNYIYRGCGVIGPLNWPAQTMDWGLHNEHSPLIEAFETWPELAPHFARIPLTEPLMAGDALIFLQGKAPHHSGIVLSDREFLHTLKARGAHVMRLDAVFRGQSILGHVTAVFRPITP